MMDRGRLAPRSRCLSLLQLSGLILFAENVCAAAGLRRQQRHAKTGSRRAARALLGTVEAGDWTFDRPICAYGARPGFGGHVQVYIDRKENIRYLNFDDDSTGSQTEVKCQGPVPPTCLPDTSLGVNDTRSCDQVDCPCDRDTLAPMDFSYMNAMMQDVTPLCETRSMLHKEDGPMRVLLVGLGGGALGSYMLSNCPEGSVRVESVEYDPRVIDVAQHFFGFPVIPGKSEVENNDGGKAVARRASSATDGQGSYDFVLVDCFMGGGKVPDSCMNDEFIKNVQLILKPQGKLIQQIWSPQYEKVIEHYQKQFGSESVKGKDIELGVNHLIIATKQGDAPVFP